MKVFISFFHEDEKFAAGLEEALRRRHIEAWSSLDLAKGEHWRQRIDQESAQADAVVFLVGAGHSLNSHLESEWRTVLRNDWESKKPLIPVLLDKSAENRVPSFLRARNTLQATNYDRLADQIDHLLKHPTESRPESAYRIAKADQESRLDALREFALALKGDASSESEEPEYR